jgi:hypothetical protein
VNGEPAADGEGQLLAILGRLPARDAARVAEHLAASVRLAMRDAAIQRARTRFYGDLPPTRAAQAMAGDLVRHAAAGQPTGSAWGDALTEILTFNRSAPVSARHLAAVLAGHRAH